MSVALARFARVDSRSIRSLDLLLSQVGVERAQQLLHFDALDGKAGIILGFAGAVIALAPVGHRLLLDLSRLAALMSGFFALAAFWPRSILTTHVSELRAHYLASDETFTKLALLDAQIEMTTSSRSILRGKALRLRAGMVSLGIAALFTALGVGVR